MTVGGFVGGARLYEVPCMCSGKGSGFTLDPRNNVWVCGTCHNPSAMVFAKIEQMILDRRPKADIGESTVGGRNGKTVQYFSACHAKPGECYYLGPLRAHRESAEEDLATHKCPTPYRESRMPTGKTPMVQLWDRLDELTAQRMDGKAGRIQLDSNDELLIQGESRGIAYALSIMVKPHFDTPTAILKHAVKRYKIARGELPSEVTPGYDSGFLPPPGDDKYAATKAVTEPKKAAPKRAAPTTKSTALKITPGQVDTIKQGLKSGIFSESDICSMYKLTPEQLKVLISSSS